MPLSLPHPDPRGARSAMDAFLQAFAALPTADDRADALAQLALRFDDSDYRQIKRLADRRSFDKDIVGELPQELLCMVFGYLDFSTPFRLHTVSRRWCAQLNSSDLLKQNLRPWYDGTVAPVGSTYEDLVNKSRGIQKFRTGNYIECAATDLEDGNSNGLIRAHLVEDTLVDVISPGHRFVRVTNLVTGKGWKVATPAREVFLTLSVSSQFIAAWAAPNTIFIWDFSGVQLARLHLPPHLAQCYSCHEQTLLCGGIVLTRRIEFYLWDLESRKGKSLLLDGHPTLKPFLESPNCTELRLLVDAPRKTFTLFVTKVCGTKVSCVHAVDDLSIHYYLINFDGQIVRESTFVLPVPFGFGNLLCGLSIGHISPVDLDNGYSVAVFTRFNNGFYRHTLFFDPERQEFSLPVLLDWEREHVRTAWWKDALYQLRSDTITRSAGVGFRLQHIDVYRTMKRIVFEDWDGEVHFNACSRIVVNGRFIVIQALCRIYVFSFEKKAKMADLDDDATVQGNKGLQRLILWKRHNRHSDSSPSVSSMWS